MELWPGRENFSNRTPSTCALADLGDGKRSRITQHLGVIKPTAAVGGIERSPTVLRAIYTATGVLLSFPLLRKTNRIAGESRGLCRGTKVV